MPGRPSFSSRCIRELPGPVSRPPADPPGPSKAGPASARFRERSPQRTLITTSEECPPLHPAPLPGAAAQALPPWACSGRGGAEGERGAPPCALPATCRHVPRKGRARQPGPTAFPLGLARGHAAVPQASRRRPPAGERPAGPARPSRVRGGGGPVGGGGWSLKARLTTGLGDFGKELGARFSLMGRRVSAGGVPYNTPVERHWAGSAPSPPESPGDTRPGPQNCHAAPGHHTRALPLC